MYSKKRTPNYWSGSGSMPWPLRKPPGLREKGPRSCVAREKRPGASSTGPSRPRRHAKSLAGLTLLLPALLLGAGCSLFTREIVRTETVVVEVPVQTPLPDELLQPCWPAPARGTTVEDFVRWAEDLLLTLEACNEDKAEIRELQPQG